MGLRTDHLRDQVVLVTRVLLGRVIMVRQVRLLEAETVHSRVEALLLIARQLAHPLGSVHGVVIQVDHRRRGLILACITVVFQIALLLEPLPITQYFVRVVIEVVRSRPVVFLHGSWGLLILRMPT